MGIKPDYPGYRQRFGKNIPVMLDLALDALRGNITGLDPDRIAMLREAV